MGSFLGNVLAWYINCPTQETQTICVAICPLPFEFPLELGLRRI